MSNKIKEAIRKLAGTDDWDKHTTILCKVNTIDLASRTCSVIPIGGDASTEIFDVQLMVNTNDGILLVPVIGSEVFITYTVRKLYFVSFFSELDKVFLITKTLTQLNDGSFGGLIKIVELVNRINGIENLLNELISLYNAHTHPGVQTGAGVTAPTTSQEANTISPITTRDNFENNLITHGQ